MKIPEPPTLPPLKRAPRRIVRTRRAARTGSRWPFERVLRWALGLGAIALTVWLVWFFGALVVYLVVGVLLAYLLQPVVTWFEGRGTGRIGAIVATFALFIGALVLVLTYTVPFVGAQFTALAEQVTVERVREVVRELEPRLPLVRQGTVTRAVERAMLSITREERITSMASALVGMLADVVYALLVVPFVTFFVLRDGPRIRRWLLRLVPNRYFEPTLALVEQVEMNLGRYFKGLLTQCLSVGIVATVMLYVVGLENAAAVGLFTGLANTIPYFGPLMGFLAGTVVGVVQTGDLSLVPGVFVAMAVTQISDNLFFQPFIFSRAARTHPLLILVVVLVGAQVAGIVGMLIAIPLSTVLRVTAQQVLWSLRHYRILRAA